VGGGRPGAWLVRVFPNKFAALSPDLTFAPPAAGQPFAAAQAFGYHEVVVETPEHSAHMASMEPQQIRLILEAYRARHRALERDGRVRFISIFRNQGASAGTSLAHPHSQIMALPLVPGDVRKRLATAARHYGAHGRCLYCDLLSDETRAASRVVARSAHFVVFAPFASRWPAEVWIAPRRHCPSFAEARAAELDDFAAVLRDTLARLETALADPDYNYVVHSGPTGEDDRTHYHWYVQIIPRLTTAAGFEMGSGMAINTIAPEAAASWLRHAGNRHGADRGKRSQSDA
jgi:UDPglucose--hexose-1-phosphate uridylyltransferase